MAFMQKFLLFVGESYRLLECDDEGQYVGLEGVREMVEDIPPERVQVLYDRWERSSDPKVQRWAQMFRDNP